VEHRHDISAFEPGEFSYRGVDVKMDVPESIEADTATIRIGDRAYEVRRSEHHGSMWMAPNVFNMYTSLAELARHMVDLDVQEILAPPARRKRPSRQQQPSRSRKR
jgi:hypothetical protein